MAPVTIVDTGPLVAMLDADDREHRRAIEISSALRPPLLTAEPVLTEVCFLLRRTRGASHQLLRMVDSGALEVRLSVAREATALDALMSKYADVPMSLADACLVRLSELSASSRVFTFDSDFHIYRRVRNKRIDLLGLEP